MNEVKDNVMVFLNKCCKEIGKIEEENFNMEIFNNFYDFEIDSPIEQLLYCGIKSVMRFNDIPLADPIIIGEDSYLYGVAITPQFKIGQYRCDFHISFSRIDVSTKEQLGKELIIECDSQKYHERDEKERRYEKKRDRYLQSKGYKVFRYTGSEICKNTLKIAAEIMSFITETDIDDIQTDSNIEG